MLSYNALEWNNHVSSTNSRQEARNRGFNIKSEVNTIESHPSQSTRGTVGIHVMSVGSQK